MPIGNVSRIVKFAREGAIGISPKPIKPAKALRTSSLNQAKTDCFVSSVKQSLKIITPENFEHHLKGLKYKSGYSIDFDSAELIVLSANTQEQAQAKFYVVQELIKLANKSDKLRGFNGDFLERIVLSTDTFVQAQLAVKLAQLKRKNGNMLLNSHAIRIIISTTDTLKQAKLKLELTKQLAKLKNKVQGTKFIAHDIGEIVSLVNNKEKFRSAKILTQLKGKDGGALPYLLEILASVHKPERAELAGKLAQLEAKNGDTRFQSEEIIQIVSNMLSPRQVILKTIQKLAKIEDGNGNFRLDGDKIASIASSIGFNNNRNLILELADNKAFLNKIDALDKSLGQVLYPEILHYGKELDLAHINKLYNFLSDNKMNLQSHGQEKITSKKIAELFDVNMFKALDLVDDSVIKYAAKLKYDGLKDFIRAAANLESKLAKEPMHKLKSALAKLSNPAQRFEKLQAIIAIQEMSSSTVFEEAVKLIKPTRTTAEQINLANKIFTSGGSYSEQIQEFFRKFNVSEKKKEVLRKFFESQQINKSLAPALTAEKQIEVIEKKIQSVKNNNSIPDFTKSEYITKLEAQISEILINPSIMSKPRLSDNVLNLLAQQIEGHINIFNSRKELNNLLSTQIYEKLEIQPNQQLLDAMNFGAQSLVSLFSGLSDKEFLDEFRKLVDLVKSDPSKPLSELREALLHNKQTKKMFKQNGLNYQKWIKFDKNSSLPFSFVTDLQEALRAVEINILNELKGNLFKSVDKTQTDKIINAILDAGYELGTENITKDGQAIVQKDLEKIVDIFKDTINNNSVFWDKPLSDNNAERLKNELIDHLLKGRKKEVADLASMTNTRMNLVVRLADTDDIGRNLFLGNHVGCCTAIGGSNAFAAPQHLMNSFVRAIEIVDKSGNSYGNSMCYFAKVEGKLSFIIDSFETNGKLGGNQVVTDAIINYAKQVTTEIGKTDIPIYFGPNYNKIDMSRLKLTYENSIEAIGRVESDTYIDALGGMTNVDNVHWERCLYEL